jgi:hypothetical protein
MADINTGGHGLIAAGNTARLPEAAVAEGPAAELPLLA